MGSLELCPLCGKPKDESTYRGAQIGDMLWSGSIHPKSEETKGRGYTKLERLIADAAKFLISQSNNQQAKMARLRYFAGMTYGEIAAHFGCTRGHVYNQLSAFWGPLRTFLVDKE